jgi:hypothetical protein
VVPLETPLPEAQAEELAKRMFFVSETILDFSMLGTDGSVDAVVVVTDVPMPFGELRRKLNVMVSDVTSHRVVPPKFVWRSATPRGRGRDIFPELLTHGMASPAGEGQVAVGGPFITLMESLDRRIRDVVVDEFGGEEFRYPTLIPTEALERCKYIESFPQFVMFVTRLHGDVDTYWHFRGPPEDSSDSRDILSFCRNTDYSLPPTMCFHTYYQCRDRSLAAPKVVTSCGKSFRYESRYHRTLERLWDFTIREVVFLGPREFVLDGRHRLMERTFDLVEDWGLSGRCEVANDPFFCQADSVERAWSQRLLELKYELRLDVESPRDVAVASFNFHERFFGAAFGIDSTAGEPAHSACAGFGLERLAYAYLCQHGLGGLCSGSVRSDPKKPADPAVQEPEWR